jgi:hypothetical protein
MIQEIKTRSVQNYGAIKTLDGNTYRFRFHWNTHTKKWYMWILGLNNAVDIKPIALLPGKNLIAQGGWGNILGEIWLVDKSGAKENPTFEEMGTRWVLEYTTLPKREFARQTGQTDVGET